MPIPQITDHFLCQVVMPALTPSTNVFVNTWFFRNDTAGGSPETMADNIRDALDAFYDDSIGTPTAARITAFMSPAIDRPNVRYRVYDLGQAAPRVPIIRAPAPTWTAAASTLKMPNECAIVLSYRSGTGTTGGGTSDKTRRGRIYVGPFQTGAIDTGGPTEDSTPSPLLLDRIREGAANVESSSLPLTWVQYSRSVNRMAVVTGGFVDAAWDTQRRRGMKAASRLTWPPA